MNESQQMILCTMLHNGQAQQHTVKQNVPTAHTFGSCASSHDNSANWSGLLGGTRFS